MEGGGGWGEQAIGGKKINPCVFTRRKKDLDRFPKATYQKEKCKEEKGKQKL